MNETPRHTSHEFFTSILRFFHFTNLIFVKMVVGGLMVNTLDSQSRSPGSRVGLAGTICCSLVRNNLLSQSLSPPRSIKGVPANCQGSLMKFWLVGGGGGRGVSSGWMSYLPQVQTEFFSFFHLILLTCKRLTKIMTISSVGFSSP